MKVHMYADAGDFAAHHRPMGLVKEGLEKHGVSVTVLPKGSAERCDMSIVWGVRDEHSMFSGRRCLVVERAYLGNRFYWTSVGFDGLNGRADFMNSDKGKDASRFEKHFKQLMFPWRKSEGEYVLVVGQVPGDQSLRLAGLKVNEFYDLATEQLLRDGHEVVFRPHPAAPRMLYTSKARTSKVTLDEDLAKAKWVVTINSNTAVDAIMAGVPATCADLGSMVADVAFAASFRKPKPFDRSEWANKISWCQWSPEELANGEFWDHLKGGMEGWKWQAAVA